MATRIFFALLTTLVLSRTSLRAQSDSLTPQQVRDQLCFTLRYIEQTHINPWHTLPKAAGYRLRDSLAASVKQRLAPEAVFLLVARLCAAIDDSHTFATSTYVHDQIVADRIPIFPAYMLFFRDSGLVVRADLYEDSVLHFGDRITAINGRSADELLRTFESYSGGSEATRFRHANEYMLSFFYACGIRSPFRITYWHGGKEATITRQGLPFNEYWVGRHRELRADGQHRFAVPPEYTFTRLPGNIGLLRINNTDGNPWDFRRFLRDTFTALRSDTISGLIVDLREASGVNPMFGVYLLQYLANKPVRLGGGSRWKVSAGGRTFHRDADEFVRASFDEGSWARYLAQKDGTILTFEPGPPAAPAADLPRYHGKLVVLIGPGTVGSGARTAAALFDYGLAPLMGAPVGEPANEYADAYFTETPLAGISIGASSRFYIRPNGNPADGREVKPALPAPPGAAGIEAAVRWLRQGK